MNKIKQNKNYPCVFRAVSFAFALLLALALIPVFPVSASSDSVDFTDFVLPSVELSSAPSATDMVNNGLHLASIVPNSSYASVDLYALVSSNDFVVYVFYSSSHFVFVSESSITSSSNPFFGIYRSSVALSNSGSLVKTASGVVSPTSLDSGTQLYYASLSASSINEVFVPEFDSTDAGLAAVREYIDNGAGSSDSLRELSFTLPMGNVAYIDISGNSGVSSEAWFSLYKSMSFWDDRGYTSQSEYIGFANSIPSSIDVSGGQFSGLSQFRWSGVPDYNIFGQAKNYQYIGSLNSSSRYLVVYNAVGNNATSGGVPITVSVSQARSVRVIPLTTDYSGGEYSASGFDSDGLEYNYDDSSDTWYWSDSGGSPSVGPSEGGKTVIDSGQLTINQWLQKIANDLGNFFAGAIGAVTTLVGYASEFFQTLGGLYSWLPAPVYSVLISALIVAITIGVIKVFL